MRLVKRIVLACLLVTATVEAQYWAQPAKTANIDVKCAGCAGRANGQMTPGFPPALGTYLGRFLDSSATNDFQQPVRSMRAVSVIPRPDLNRIYMQIGSSVMAWNLDSFFARVAAGERLQPGQGSGGRPVPDVALPFDSWYYAELQGSGWDVSSGGDGQTRLFGLDVDDQGFVYLATKVYRWGIVRDDRRREGALMQFVWQAPPTADAVIPNAVAALKGSDGRYYAVISDVTGSTLNVYDMTDRANPVKRGNVQRSMYRFAKNADATRVAIATVDGRLEIYTTDALVSGGQPLFTRSDPAAMIRGVASDGVNFFSAMDASSGLVISSYAPSGSGYVKTSELQTGRATLATESLRYGGGYLTQAGITDGSYELRLFKVAR